VVLIVGDEEQTLGVEIDILPVAKDRFISS
jgi:hypothetical protein